MNSKTFALYGGALMVIIGAFSLLPGLEGSSTNLPSLKVETSYGLFLGLFPLNIFNKLALITFGLAGITISRKEPISYSVTYSKVVLSVMGVLAILGLFPQTATLGGMWPLYGGEVVAHGLFAIVAGASVLADTKGQPRKMHYS